ncbi:MAG: response regulator [Maribacter sp.]
MKKVHICCIIDDDPIFIYGTKRMIKEVDFSDQIIVYTNGQEAIEGLYEISTTGEPLPDVIFLDLNMPIMDGWEFLEEFDKLPHHNIKKTIIYIISSSVDPRDLERIKNYKQVTNYILKPVTPEDLEQILSVSKSER